MITAMRAIARHLEKSVEISALDRVITLHQRIDKVIVLRIKRIESSWKYEQSSIVDYSRDSASKFLYRQGPSNGPGPTPAALITDVEKTFTKKTLPWFGNALHLTKGLLQQNDVQYIKGIGDELKREEKRIIKDVSSLIQTIDRSKGNTLLTILIEDNGEEYYLGEIDVFVKIFLELVRQRYYMKYGTISRGHGQCYVCNEERDVYGFVTDVFSFYTLDKRGFAPNLHVSDGWKAFPVCFDCAIALETAKKMLDDNLLFNFYGAKYYLIPKSILDSEESLGEVLSILSGQDKAVSLADSSGRLTEDENEILETASTFSDSILLNFLFFITEQSSMRILGYIEDVLPSRIAKVFKLKTALEDRGLYYEASIIFNLSILRDILALGRDAKDFKEFIYVTGRLLNFQQVSRKLLLDRVLTNLESYRNRWKLGSLMGSPTMNVKRKSMDIVLRSMMLLEYFELAQSESGGEPRRMSGIEEKSREQIVMEIFESHPSFFVTHSQRAAFLIGLLTGRLMAIQGHERGSAPFEKKLHNLRFTMTRLQRLYLQVEAKLKAYGHSRTYEAIEHLLSDELLNAAGEKVDGDELSLSFVIGLNQSYKLRRVKGEDT